jgi:cell division protein FtsB
MVTGPNSSRNWLYRWRRKLATAGTGLLLAVIGYHALFGANGLMVYEQKRRESAELDHQIKVLQQQNSGMEQEIKALKNDPKTIEKEARERLRYARPGEVVYTLPAAPVAPSQQTSQQKK